MDPQLLDGEILYKEHIRMEPLDNTHNLDPASRVNYRKTYTVEHNLKIMIIGSLTRAVRAQVVTDYNFMHPRLFDPESDIPASPSDVQADGGSWFGAVGAGGRVWPEPTNFESTPRYGNQSSYPVGPYMASSSVATTSFSPLVSVSHLQVVPQFPQHSSGESSESTRDYDGHGSNNHLYDP